MNPLTFIIISLAVWKLSCCITFESGPLDVFARLRAHLARSQKHAGGFFDMVSCIRCVSVWIGLAGALFVSDSFLNVIGYTFAFSGVTMLLERLTNKK